MPELQEDRRPFVHWLASRVTQKEFLELRATMDVMERYLESKGQSADVIYRAARNFNRSIVTDYQKKFQSDVCFHHLHEKRMEDVQRIFSYLIEFSSWHRYSSLKQPYVMKKVSAIPPKAISCTDVKHILQQNFSRGIRVQSKIDLKRFRVAWEKEEGTALQWNDEFLRKRLEELTILCGSMYYLPETLMDEKTKERVRTYIEDCFAQGISAIYFDAIYKKFEEDFQRTRISNVEMLRMYLGSIAENDFFLSDKYISRKRHAAPKPREEVRQYLVEQNMPVTIEQMTEDLSFLDETLLRRILAGPDGDEFIRNAQGEYFHASIVRFTVEEIQEIRRMIQEMLEDRGYMTGRDLMHSLQTQLPDIMERYPYLTELGLRGRVAYELNNVFSFRGSLISERGETLAVKDVFAGFARKHDHFTMTDLDLLKDDLDTQIDFPSVYRHALRISKNEFVSKHLARFDIEATDDVLDRLCAGDELPLKDVTFWGSFPDAGYPWNPFLLQHYVADFSRQFHLACNGYTVDTPTGIIVRNTSRVQDFDEALIELLAKSELVLEEKGALQYLQDKGAIARKKYHRIAYVVDQAKTARGRKG